MSGFHNLAYRVSRRLVREFRQRACGLDSAIDRTRYRLTVGGGKARGRLLEAASLAPWGDDVDLGFVDQAVAERLIAAADDACSHRFNLLGSGPTDLGEEIDWHRDFKSGHRWDPGLHHARIKWEDLPAGVDIKVPWELSRCMHFATLGLADHLSGERKYYDEFKKQVRHWIAANPYGRGVNWNCPMDVALRVVNWLNAVMLFRHRISEDEDPDFFEQLGQALWLAGLHVRRNLEWSGPKSTRAGNHFLSDLTGLLAAGAVFRDHPTGRRWFAFASEWLEREIQRQVNPDGTNFETSTSYHRLVTEMFMWSERVAAHADRPMSESFRERLWKMAGFVTAYSSPGGNSAQFGDNDSGRLLTAGIADAGDHRYLTPSEAAPGGELDRWLLTGGSATATDFGDGSFPDGGYWFAREGDAWMGVRAGTVSHGGAHAHCDQLALVLSVGSRDFLVDRGTGVYTPDVELRNRLRSTRSHNTPTVNGWEQNHFGSGRMDVFRMADDTASEVETWDRQPGCTRLVAYHRGFQRFRRGMICRRSVVFETGQLVIDDEFSELVAGDELEWRFHLGPGVKADLGDSQASLSASNVVLTLQLPPELRCTLEDTEHSSAYGSLEAATSLHVSGTARKPGAGGFRFQLNWKGRIPHPNRVL
jgi:hypothetical protein